MRIIFFRHGVAEIRGRVPEFERALTDKGIIELGINLPNFTPDLDEHKTVVWSSPLVRARETAELLVEDFKPKSFELNDLLAQGDLGEILESIRNLPKKTVLVMVGHEPYLSEWTYELSGIDMSIKKGGIVEIDFNRSNPGKSKLKKYIKPIKFRPEDYLVDDELSSKEEIIRVLYRNLLNIKSRRDAFIADPDDIETVHKLRVSIRSFRSLIYVFKKHMDEASYKNIQDNFRKLGGMCARLREIDVLIEFVNEALNGESCDNKSDSLLEVLKDEQKQERISLLEKVSAREFEMLYFYAFGKLIGSIDFDKFDENFEKYLNKFLNKKYKKLNEMIENLTEFEFKQAHGIRLLSKKLRYITEAFDYLIHEDLNQNDKMKKLQTELGEICDLIRNPEAVSEIIKAYDNPEVVNQARLFGEIQDAKREELINRFNDKY